MVEYYYTGPIQTLLAFDSYFCICLYTFHFNTLLRFAMEQDVNDVLSHFQSFVEINQTVRKPVFGQMFPDNTQVVS